MNKIKKGLMCAAGVGAIVAGCVSLNVGLFDASALTFMQSTGAVVGGLALLCAGAVLRGKKEMPRADGVSSMWP